MRNKILITVLLCISMQIVSGQILPGDLSGKVNIITTAVPFLNVLLSPTINGGITSVPDGTPGPGLYGNPGLLALEKSKLRATFDYLPWIREVLPDSYFAGIGASYRLNRKHTIGASFRYFSLGHHTYTRGGVTQTIYPNEFAGSILYSCNLDTLTGLGIGLKYIRSNLTGGTYIGGIESHPGVAFAADLGFAKQMPGRDGRVDHFIGVSLRNVGTKISYTSNSDRDFLPITLSAGYAFRLNFTNQQSLSFSYECSKLLVPTPPFYYSDSVDQNGDPAIEAGYDANVGVFRGMIQSFYDAPNGLSEEFSEIEHSFGIVYKYRFLAAGAGYHYESAAKGNRKYYSFGMSGNFKIDKAGHTRGGINLSYLLPVDKISYMRNTIQVGINLII